MKIVHVHNWYRYFGGEDLMFEDITRLLIDKGNEVICYQSKSKTISGFYQNISAFMSGIYSLKQEIIFTKLVLKNRPDVVHIHNLYPLISPSILVVCNKHRIPVIMTCHNYRLICPTANLFQNNKICELCIKGREYWCIYNNCTGNYFKSIEYALRQLLARKRKLFLKNVTIFMSPTEFLKNKLIEGGYPEERIVVVPNMTSTNPNCCPDYNGTYVGYAGQILPAKGIHVLLKAAEQSKLPLKIAGDYTQMKEIMFKKAMNVQLVGRLAGKELEKFYQNARFMVVPSTWFEVFPLAVIEAMIYGQAIIASKIGGLKELIEEGKTGLFFEPGNHLELSDKMVYLWEHPDLCRLMGIEARKKAMQFNREIYYERLMRVYERAQSITKYK